MSTVERYQRNAPEISKTEQIVLAKKRVFVAGCGGLGGFIIEILARCGVGNITVADGDIFTKSNLNRQLFSTENNIGKHKTQVAVSRIAEVNPEVNIISICEKLTPGNTDNLIAGHDVIIDALDNGKSRIMLARAARRAGITQVCGAISGWRGRVIVLNHGDNADFLWPDTDTQQSGDAALCFTAAYVAAAQAAETVKVLLGRRDVSYSRILELDLLNASYDEIALS